MSDTEQILRTFCFKKEESKRKYAGLQKVSQNIFLILDANFFCGSPRFSNKISGVKFNVFLSQNYIWHYFYCFCIILFSCIFLKYLQPTRMAMARYLGIIIGDIVLLHTGSIFCMGYMSSTDCIIRAIFHSICIACWVLDIL